MLINKVNVIYVARKLLAFISVSQYAKQNT